MASLLLLAGRTVLVLCHDCILAYVSVPLFVRVLVTDPLSTMDVSMNFYCSNSKSYFLG